MATDPTQLLRVAIVTALKSAGGPGAPVYDRVPDNQPPPAVILDTIDLNDATTKDGGTRGVFFEVVTVSRGRSKVEAEAYMAAVFTRLEDVALSGVSATRPRLQSQRMESEGDGLTHVGRQLFRIVML
jgi:hypothetical protein